MEDPTTTNPFADPAIDSTSTSTTTTATSPTILPVSQTATLTLGTDSLILLDDSLRRPSPSNLCGLLPGLSKTTRAIPFHHVLWADFQDQKVSVAYTQPVGRKGKSCKVSTIEYILPDDKLVLQRAAAWVAALLERAYPSGTPRRRRVKVLVNPFGGQGHAQKLWERDVRPIFEAARWEIDVEKTTSKGHAVEIAQSLDLERYDVVACASGDGLPHEVFNGLAKHSAGGRKALGKVAVVQIPCGSGNAMSLNLNGTDRPSLAAVEIVKGRKTALDLVAVTQGEKMYWSFLSQAVGIIAESDLGTESLRWMGSFRFTWGVLVRVLGKTIYPAEVSIVLDSDDKTAILQNYRQAISEHEAARAKDLPLPTTPPLTPSAEEPTSILPTSLKYGTVQSPLHPAFHTQDMPHLGNFYVGNMCYMSPDTPFFLASLPADGKMDLVCVPGDISRLTALKMLTTVEDGKMMEFAEVRYQKVVAYRITPRREMGGRGRLGTWLGGGGAGREGLIAVDGEKVAFEPFQAEVVPGLGRVLSRSGGVYEVGELGR